MTTRPRSPIAWTVGLVLVAAGCGGDAGPVPAPVTGQVTFRGKPIPEAMVTFSPAAPGTAARPVNGVTDPAGRFRLSYLTPGDGALPGRYNVGVVWNELVQDGDTMKRTGRLLMPKRYADPTTSGLTVEITPGENALPPFALTE